MNTEQCPCGSNKPFTECCMPLLQGTSKAATAEQLMRSRYTAFYTKNTAYLLASWSKETRPKQLDSEEIPVKWVGLKVLETEQGKIKDSSGIVHFIARFIAKDRLCNLQEKSRFIKEEGLWFYVDGISQSSTMKISRNSQCPCGSGRKFKRCCL